MERIGEWFRFGADRYARVSTIYSSMCWSKSNVGSYFGTALAVCVAPYGGPIAIIKSDGLNASSISVLIFGGSGVLLRQFLCPADAGSSVLCCGWNSEESLVIFTGKSTCLVYDISQQGPSSSSGSSLSVLVPVHSIKLPAAGGGNKQQAQQQQTQLLSILKPSGLYTLDGDGGGSAIRAVLFQERKDPQVVSISPSLLSSNNGGESTCLEVLPEEMSEEGETLLFIGRSVTPARHLASRGTARTGSVVCVNIATEEATDLKLKLAAPVVSLALCLSAKSLVLFTQDGVLVVVSSNFQELLYSIDLGVAGVRPMSFVWAGTAFVLVTFAESDFGDEDCYASPNSSFFALLVSVEQKSETRIERLSWESDGGGKFFVAPEVDGVTIVTETSRYFVEQLDAVLVNLCRLKNPSPAARLALAHQQFSNGEVRGLLYIRSFVRERHDQFIDAVDELLDASLMEYDVDQQERILKCAAFAKSFCPAYDADRYSGVLCRLRILNALRDPAVGVAMSIRQYERLSSTPERLRALTPSEAQVLVDRLINRRAFAAALDVCQLMRMKANKVVVQWSCAHVQDKRMDEATIRADVARVLAQCPGATYIDASLSAFRCGREQLAIHLLNDDPRSQNKVILLLQMQQTELALRTALESNESDLIHFVLVHIMSTKTSQQLLNTVSGHASAYDALCLGANALSSWRDRVKSLLEDTRQHYRLAMWRLERKLLGDDSIDPNTAPPAPLAFSMDDDDGGDQPIVMSDEADGSDGTPKDDEEEDMPSDAESAERRRNDEDAKKKDKKHKSKKGGGLFSGLVSGVTDALTAGVSMVTGADKSSSKKKSGAKEARKKKERSGIGSDDDDAEDRGDAFDTDPGGPSSGSALTMCPGGIPKKRRHAGTESFTVDDALAVIGSLSQAGTAVSEADAKHMRMQVDLLEEQRRLAEMTGDCSFHNQTVVKTLELCVAHDLDVKADQLRGKYQVSEKKFWFLKLRALCGAGKWDAVDRLGGSGSYKKVKSPIGFQPFVEELAKHHRNDQAALFVARLPQLAQRVEWFVKLDCFQRAADDAYSEQDVELLQQILRRAMNPTIIQYITAKIKELQ
jgi:hypothetical protein